MSQDEVQLLMMKGIVADLPLEDQAKVTELRETLLGMIEEHPDHMPIAMALVGLEKSIENA